MRRLLLTACIVTSSAVGTSAHANDLDLPPLLRMQDGRTVDSATMWHAQRRPEILELFREHVYGRAPVERPERLEFDVQGVDPQAMDGAATRKLLTISFAGPGGEQDMEVVIFIPNEPSKPVPAFLLICNRGAENIDPTREVKSPFWPAEAMIARGYAAMAFQVNHVAPDRRQDQWQNGVHAVFDEPPRPPDAWGTIAAWGWGASRVLDYCETDDQIDAQRVAVVGHSRGGKASLWAGAEDERFAVVVSNNSGCTGAALARRKHGESVRQINERFPHWFCENYEKYNDREEQLPVDQHMLIALMAPRPVYVASAEEDSWADPKGEFLSCLYGSEAWRLLGHAGLGIDEMPAVDDPIQKGRVGYHIRSGGHNLTEYDWQRFMDFADKHWRE